jgi:hypothetical protein
MLHPQGKQWLGYPCVEHKSSSLGLRAGMLGEMTGAEDMVMKSWKVCDCVKKVPTRNSLAILMPNGTITSFIFGKGANGQQQQPTVAVPLMPVYDMTIKDVVTQWLAAKAGNAGLPTATISPQLATDLKQLLPGFMTPSILIANTSAALMMHPDWMTEVPAFVLPNSALGAFKSFLPDLTALPTLAVDDSTTAAEAAAMLELPSDLLISDITIDALPALASKLGLPTFLKLNPSTATNKVWSASTQKALQVLDRVLLSVCCAYVVQRQASTRLKGTAAFKKTLQNSLLNQLTCSQVPATTATVMIDCEYYLPEPSQYVVDRSKTAH